MRTLSLFAILSVSISAQETSRDERWRADLDFLVRELPSRHPNLFTRVTREQWLASADDLRSRIPDLRDHQVQAGLARLVAAGNDAHTSMSAIPVSGARNISLRFYWFSDGLFVTHGAVPFARALGKRVVRIGAFPVEEALEMVRPFLSHENEQWLKHQSPAYLRSADVLHAAGVIPSNDRVPYTFAEGDGTEFALTIGTGEIAMVPARHPARPLNPLFERNADLNYWFDYLAEKRALYIKYNRCAESTQLSMVEFTRQVIAFIESNPVESLMLDLRNNSGGNSAVIQPLALALNQAALRGVLPLARPPYIIIGRQTFSSGMLNAIDFKSQGAALLGEPTGGKPYGYGEVLTFNLPNSGLLVPYSTRLFRNGSPDDPYLRPDVTVPLTSAAYFAERDEFLEAALN